MRRMRGWITENKEFCFECPYCGKVICSPYIKQAMFNIEMHVKYCKKRKKLEEGVRSDDR